MENQVITNNENKETVISTIQPMQYNVVNSAIGDNGFYMSETCNEWLALKPENVNDLIALQHAIDNPTEELSNHYNEELTINNIYLAEVIEKNENGEIVIDDNGEIKSYARCVLFDTFGNYYNCGSIGVLNSVKTIIRLFGTPENWKKGLVVKAIQRTTQNKRRMTVLEVVRIEE